MSVNNTHDAAAPGKARIVWSLFTSALGGGLSAWAHAIGEDSEARLRRLLLGTRKIPFTVAPETKQIKKSKGIDDFLSFLFDRNTLSAC
jgi:hypothetical protein